MQRQHGKKNLHVYTIGPSVWGTSRNSLAVIPQRAAKRDSANDVGSLGSEAERDENDLGRNFLGYALDEHAIVSIADVKGNITYVNDKFVEVSGYSSDELIGKNHRLLKSSEHSPMFYKRMWRTIANGKTWSGEIKNLSKNGVPYWVKATIVPYLNEQGKPVRYLSIRTDITKEKSAEALRQQQSSFDLIQDEIYLFWPDSLKIFYANKTARKRAKSFGKDPIGATPMDFAKGLTETEFLEWVRPLLEEQQDRVTIYRDLTQENGEETPVEISLQYFAPRDEEPRFFASIRDISARKQAEKAKMDFLAVVSHELRTPLTIIIGYVSFLSSPEVLPAARKLTGALSTLGEKGTDAGGLFDEFLKEVAGYAQRAKLSGDHLRELVNSILDFSKIYAGKMELNIREVAVGSVLSEIVDQFEREAREKDLDVSCDLSVDTVMADEVRLRQILINLIGNAVKFTDTGCITVEVEKNGQFVEFRVIDTGPGLAENDRDKLFELFTQIDASTTRQNGGTGLGLTIAKQLAELHGGEIGVSSEPGEGSTFWFRLPAKQP